MTTAKLTTQDSYNVDLSIDDPAIDINEDLKLVEAEYTSDEDRNLHPARRRKSSVEDNIGAFFKEMARYPLLTAEEEIVLANDVKL